MPTKSRGLAIALALFLGGFGVHWFYLERPGKGLIYLLFCWTLIPAILSFFTAIIWTFTDPHNWRDRYLCN